MDLFFPCFVGHCNRFAILPPGASIVAERSRPVRGHRQWQTLRIRSKVSTIVMLLFIAARFLRRSIRSIAVDDLCRLINNIVRSLTRVARIWWGCVITWCGWREILIPTPLTHVLVANCATRVYRRIAPDRGGFVYLFTLGDSLAISH